MICREKWMRECDNDNASGWVSAELWLILFNPIVESQMSPPVFRQLIRDGALEKDFDVN